MEHKEPRVLQTEVLQQMGRAVVWYALTQPDTTELPAMIRILDFLNLATVPHYCQFTYEELLRADCLLTGEVYVHTHDWD